MVDASNNVWSPPKSGWDPCAPFGVVRYNGAAFVVGSPTSCGLLSRNVKCIAQDADGNMWFGTDKGASRLAADYIEEYFGTAAE